MNKSTGLRLWCLALAAAALLPGNSEAQRLKRAIVYSGNTWRHNSIPFVSKFAVDLGKEKGFVVDEVQATSFTDATLANYQVVILNNNVGFGATLNDAQRASLQKWYEAGGAIAAFHGAMDHLNRWSWYSDLVGTIFVGHSDISNAVTYVPDGAETHPIMEGYGASIAVGSTTYPRAVKQFDEFYNYQNNMTNVSNVKVLLQMAHGSYSCKCNASVMTPTAHQAAYVREYKGGRVFVTTFGGVPDNNAQSSQTTFSTDPTKGMLYRAIQWLAGDLPIGVSITPKGERRILAAQLLPAGSMPALGWDMQGRLQRGVNEGPTLLVDKAGTLRLIQAGR